MQTLLKHIKKTVLIVVALQILNVGLFVQGFETVDIPNVEENIINSVTEYVAEIMLQEKDAFPETIDDSSSGTSNQKDQHNITVKSPEFKMIKEDYFSYSINNVSSSTFFISFKEKNIADFISEIVPPPPKC